MLAKGSMELPELFDDQKENKKPEIHPESGFIGLTNLSAKGEMAKELYCIGLSRKAIGRILHLNEEAMDHHIDIPKVIGKEV